ncbi:MAG: desulfoferrodoxin [Lentisphaerae bacterium]|nr:desulfoferrodoxin [Lentisphaerota bacterium]
MTKLNEIYVCHICGNIVEVLHTGPGELVCCKQPMELQVAGTKDASEEKHVPVYNKTDDSITVLVGEVPHPMEEEHYIEWVDIIDGNTYHRKHLKPGEKPEAVLNCKTGENIIVREYCNIHGLWQAE